MDSMFLPHSIRFLGMVLKSESLTRLSSLACTMSSLNLGRTGRQDSESHLLDSTSLSSNARLTLMRFSRNRSAAPDLLGFAL